MLIERGREADSSPENPTGLPTISEPHDQEIGKFYLVQKRLATDFEDTNLCCVVKRSVGSKGGSQERGHKNGKEREKEKIGRKCVLSIKDSR